MRTITQTKSDVTEAFRKATRQAYEWGFHWMGPRSADANAESMDASTQALETLDAALAEVPDALEQRIAMWQTVIARSTDDDEIRDAQAAASELRWLLLQLKPKEAGA